MKNKHLWIPLFVFLGAGVVSLIASIIDFKGVNPQLSYSSEMIQLNYNGASKGLDPNGNSFDAINFMTDDVIEGALAASNLSGEKYELERVKQYIAIENVVPKNLASGLVANATSSANIQVQVKGVQSVIDSIKPEDIKTAKYLSMNAKKMRGGQKKLTNTISAISKLKTLEMLIKLNYHMPMSF